MDWGGEKEGHHPHIPWEGHHHGHGDHQHCQGSWGHGHGRMMHGYRSWIDGAFGARMDMSTDATQQPKKRSHMEDSNSWDIVKATQFGILERCKELVEAGYDVRQPDKENVSLLHWAAINNRLELVKYFISKGAIVDQLGGDLNSTPLHWAIRQGHLPMVILLMRHGADPLLTDGEGFNALHLAVLFQHLPIAAYLMAKGQEVDCPEVNGHTSLMLAAQKIIGPEPTNFLVKCNSSVNAVNKVNGNAALHCAVLAGNVDSAHILLEAGANVDLQNAKGHTPLDLAHQVHSPLLVHMLSHVQKERTKSNSSCYRLFNRYRFQLQLLFCTAVVWVVGAITDLKSDSWLLKGCLLAAIITAVNLLYRRLGSQEVQKLLPACFLMASVFWMLVTWYLRFVPEIQLATVHILFTLSSTGLLYYYYCSWNTDPGYIRTTEEEKKKNIVMLAESGCLDPRIFCTSCMMRKPLRASHCFSCESCVARHDQHSMWINGCVGARNHHLYIWFLFFLTVLCFWMFYGSIKYWARHFKLNYRMHSTWDLLAELVTLSPWVLYIFSLAFLHITWASAMLLLQIYQIALYGLTTTERMNLIQQQRKMSQSFSLRQNPYNSGVVRNMVNFFQLRCCGLCKPVVIDWTQQFSLGPEHALANMLNNV